MGQTIIIYDTSTTKKVVFDRFTGGPEFFHAMWGGIIPYTRAEQKFRPHTEKTRAWAKIHIPEFRYAAHPLHRLLELLDNNEHLWIYDLW